MTTPDSPRFTLVSAVYGVAGFLEDFISSIEKQTFPLDRVQVVMVDDGSVDGSLDLLRAWAERRPELVTLVTQANAGQAMARNQGLEHATGEWVTFPDPDDALSERYLENVDRFISEHAEVDLVATNRWIWNDETGQVTNTHPLRHMLNSQCTSLGSVTESILIHMPTDQPVPRVSSSGSTVLLVLVSAGSLRST